MEDYTKRTPEELDVRLAEIMGEICIHEWQAWPHHPTREYKRGTHFHCRRCLETVQTNNQPPSIKPRVHSIDEVAKVEEKQGLFCSVGNNPWYVWVKKVANAKSINMLDINKTINLEVKDFPSRREAEAFARAAAICTVMDKEKK